MGLARNNTLGTINNLESRVGILPLTGKWQRRYHIHYSHTHGNIIDYSLQHKKSETESLISPAMYIEKKFKVI